MSGSLNNDTNSKVAAVVNEKKKKTSIANSGFLRRRLYREALPDWPIIGVGVAAMLVTTGSNQALPMLMGRLIDCQKSDNGSSHNGNRSSLTSSLVVVILSGGLASCIRTVSLQTAAARIAARLRQTAVECLLLHQPLQWFQNTAPTAAAAATAGTVTKNTIDAIGSASASEPDDAAHTKSNANVNGLVSRSNSDTKDVSDDLEAMDAKPQGMTPAAIASVLSDDVIKMSETLTSGTANLLRSTSAVVWSTYHMLTLNPTLLLLAVSVVPVVGAGAMLLQKSVSRATRNQRLAAESAASFLQERLAHVAMVRQAHRGKDELNQYAHMEQDAVQLAHIRAWHSGAFMGFLFAATASALSLVVWKGSQSMRDGTMTGGQLTTFSSYCFLLGLGTSGVVKAVAETTAGLVSAERYYLLLPQPKQIPGGSKCLNTSSNKAISASDSNRKTAFEPNGSASMEETINNNAVNIEMDHGVLDLTTVEEIYIQNLCFSYSSHKPVLRDVSFSLPLGKVVALVGENGQGKSTVAALLSSLYEAESGGINIKCSNGTTADFSSLSPTTKRSLVQVIPQTTSLFNMSVFENVRYCRPSATEEEVFKALEEAQCQDFVSRLDAGIESAVGLNGCQLSGGERQRLALARALLSDPSVLILDEPSTSMDAKGLEALSVAVRSARERHRALLLITHQPRSLELADVVLVLKDGRIVEDGTYKQLRSDANSSLCKLMPTVYKKG